MARLPRFVLTAQPHHLIQRGSIESDPIDLHAEIHKEIVSWKNATRSLQVLQSER